MSWIKRNGMLAIRITTVLYFVLIVAVIVARTNQWFRPVFQWVLRNIGDKWMHFLLVGLLALLLNLSLRCACVRLKDYRIQIGSLILVVLATAEEFSQILFKSRAFDPMDMSCNLIGIFVFGLIAWLIGGWAGLRNDSTTKSGEATKNVVEAITPDSTKSTPNNFDSQSIH